MKEIICVFLVNLPSPEFRKKICKLSKILPIYNMKFLNKTLTNHMLACIPWRLARLNSNSMGRSKTKSPTGEGGALVLLTSVETVKRLSADE